LVLVALLAWPAPEVEAPADPGPTLSVASWPARGSDAENQAELGEVAAAWRTSAVAPGVLSPGEVIEPLYLGDPDGYRVGLIRSTTDDGRLLVAAAVQRNDGWRVLDVAEVTSDVPWLVLPGGDPPRVLAAPDVASAESLLVRRADGLWTRVAIRDDGVTFTLRSLDGQVPVLGVVRSTSGSRGLYDVAGLSSMSVLPVESPVRAVAPRWGRSSVLTPPEFDAALFARPALPEGTDRLAVLASARVPGGRAVLVETESVTDGQLRRLLVVPGADGEVILGDRPVVENNLAAAVAPRGGGRVLVLAAAAPSIARVEVRLPDGTSVIDGIGPTAVVLAPPLPEAVTVLGKRTNGVVVASIALPLAGTSERSPG
jgi:hypothetical protein